jgi:phosphoserine phosphatase
MPAIILSKSDRFKGDVLGIPVLREKIFAMTGTISRQEIMDMANDLFAGYNNIYKIEENKINYKKQYGQDLYREMMSHRRKIRNFLAKYKEGRVVGIQE